MNAKLKFLLISAGLGAVGGVAVSISAGWGVIAALLMYGTGGSLSLGAASLLILAAERPAPEKPAHA